MKVYVMTGWGLLAIEAIFVAIMFLQPNVGDDAAGRGMARGFGIVLAPVLLLAAALFIWGQRGGPRAAFWVGFGVMAIPLVWIALTFASGKIGTLDRAAGRARFGKFSDARLTRLARAIEQDDTAAVRAALGEGPVDFTARSKRGRTILGRAIEHANGFDGGPASLESVRMLLAAGAKPTPNVIEPEFYQGDPDAHLLVVWVFAGNSPRTVPLLDMLLAAGADPNARDHEGQALYFSTIPTLAKLEVLAQHGADLTMLDTRSDRQGWTPAMVAAYLGNWDIVPFLLDHGVQVDYVAPDGASLRTIIAAKKRESESDSSFATVVRMIGASEKHPAR